jgi:hypothetical protein
MLQERDEERIKKQNKINKNKSGNVSIAKEFWCVSSVLINYFDPSILREKCFEKNIHVSVYSTILGENVTSLR